MMIKSYWEKVPYWVKNRYAITVIVFTVWMLFFDSNDAFMLYKLKNELSTIQSEKEYFQNQIKETRSDLDNLLNDNKKLEKFAREKYLMKNSNEEIFVITVEEE
ncbi:MAG: FtsB family cell division protein [Salibacteraceae bacterium]